MTSRTLAFVLENTSAGAAFENELAAFIDSFEQSNASDRLESLDDEPRLIEDAQLNALIGAIGEYLAKQYRIGRVPSWTSHPARQFDRAWHTSCLFIDWRREFLTDGMREYLTFASPAEFASRNIFTEEQPLRRARGPFGAQDTQTT